MLKNIIENCTKLENGWTRESFPGSATAVLENLEFKGSLEAFEAEVGEWLESAKLPKQLNLYFWRKNDTLIHSHGFRGAFKILYGVSLHEEFNVKTVEQFSRDLLKTKLSQKSIKIMKAGDVQLIGPEMALTHRVVHLADPTVTLCVRTVEDSELSQWHHLSSGLSFQKKHISEKTIKKNLYFQYLLQSDLKKAKSFYVKLLNELSTAEQISLYEGVCFDQIGLDPDVTELLSEMIYERFQKENWFKLYAKHYESIQSNLQESYAESAELKLVAHAINNKFSRKQLDELLGEFSKKSSFELTKELKENTYVFTEGFEDRQLDILNKFS